MRLKTVIYTPIVILIIVIVALIIFKDTAITKIVEMQGTKALNTGVNIDSISTNLSYSLSPKRVEIKNLSIENAKKEVFSLEPALILKNAIAEIAVIDYDNKKVVVDKIIIDGLSLRFENHFGENNLKSLYDNLGFRAQNEIIQRNTPVRADEAFDITINKIILTNLTAIESIDGNIKEIVIPDITINNFRSEPNSSLQKTAIKLAERIYNEFKKPSS